MDSHYTVSGMHCQHCVDHVKTEVSAVAGVRRVRLDLDGQLTVSSKSPVEFGLIEAAVAEAGDYGVRPD